MVLHGHLRTTADLDLVVALDEGNARRAIRALESLGFRPRAPVPASQFADATARAGWIESKGLPVFSMWSDRVAGRATFRRCTASTSSSGTSTA